MWLKLEGHYQSKAITNQAKVYNNFLALKFKGTNMDQFISDLTGHISNLSAVGLKIGIPKDFQLHENLFCKLILDKIPSSLIHTQEVLIQNQPLTVESLTKLLKNRSRDDTTIRIKSKESAMKAVSQSSVKCKNGQDNPLVTSHLEENCFELYPEQKIHMEKRCAKARAKGKAKKASAKESESVSNVWRACVMRVSKSKELGPNTAYLDSAASHHMVTERRAFSTYSTNSTCKIKLLTVSPGKGIVHVKTLSGKVIKLERLHVPKLVGNLISLGCLMQRGCLMVLTGKLTSNLVCKGVPMFKVKLSKRNVLLIKLDVVKCKSSHLALLSTKSQSDIENLHRRAGHPSNDSLKRMHNLSDFTINCEACSLSKSHCLPYHSSLPKSSHCLENIHFDLSGCINPSTSDGYNYYFKLTDHYSSCKFFYLLRRKSEAFECFKKFHKSVTTLHSCPIKRITTDGGGEFNLIEFKEFLESNGIASNITAPYTSQQNLVAKRGNYITAKKARTLLKQANLPLWMWGYAVEAAVFLENVTPTRKNDWVSVYELWFFRPFDQSHLRPFGCRAFINLPKAKQQLKFLDTARKGIMVGYQLGMHNWRILREDKKVELSHDVTFDKTFYPGISTLDSAGLQSPPSSLIEELTVDDQFNPNVLPSGETLVVDDSGDSDLEVESLLVESSLPPPAPSDSRVPSPERGPGLSHPPQPGFDIVLQPVNQKAPQDISSAVDEGNIISHKRRACLAMADEDWDFNVQCFHAGAQFYDQMLKAPKSFSKAMKSPNSASWKEAIDSELAAMDWLRKFDENGALTKYKAGLSAAGNFQIEGINYSQTYAPTICPTALRALLSKGAAKGLLIHQMDVKNAFLNGNLDKTIYLRPPAGLHVPKGKCLLLVKSIYGLKQAPHIWHQELSAFFFKDVDQFKNIVLAKYLMEDLGPLRHLLGMKIEHVGKTLHISQGVYAEKVLALYGMDQACMASTPFVPNKRLLPASQKQKDDFQAKGINYRQLVGLLSYLAVSTRPNISFAMSQLSQYLEKPGTNHWDASIHLLRYLAGTRSLGLTLGSTGSSLTLYTDADYTNDVITSYSYYGYILLLGKSLLSWKSKKYLSVSSSTTEAEYTGLYEAGCEATWLVQLLNSLNIPHHGLVLIMCNNQVAISLSKNTEFHDRTKHFRVHLHWIREKVTSGEVDPIYISTHSNLTDFSTKSLMKVKHHQCIEGINLLG
ncbi:hypothetical protein PCANC_27726 [Puccinia coronata f. sp. avenae]|uniref:Integrase catalytic domain-containing protein n=1 Tax=Puccinia coronata f. sp. avenae TaxID=200324 RepID=A0A2N5TNW8_9BASI|nr:hypothetical protein PCANC_27726 [Puccinia coronata f. sp. avenae]